MTETKKVWCPGIARLTTGAAECWCRLQRVSCYHSTQLYKSSAYYLRAGVHRVGSIGVPEVIRENCDILGRGDETEIKNRLWWYCVYYPDIVNGSV